MSSACNTNTCVIDFPLVHTHMIRRCKTQSRQQNDLQCLQCHSIISTNINTKMSVCLSVCVCVYSRFSRPFGIRLGYRLAQSCLMLPKVF